jgi:antitoxin component YwqK of YwqJK toxin-antitoxin module
MHKLIIVIYIFLTINISAQDTLRYDSIRKEYYLKYPNNDTIYVIGKEKIGAILSNYKYARFEGNGYRKSWFPSGKLQSYNSIRNNVYSGLSISFYSNGNISHKSYYINGVVNGQEYLYFENGKLWSTVYLDSGKEHGVKLNYDEDGKLRVQMFYYYGVPYGEWKYFNKEGILSKIIIHEGREIKEIKCPCDNYVQGSIIPIPEEENIDWEKIMNKEMRGNVH